MNAGNSWTVKLYGGQHKLYLRALRTKQMTPSSVDKHLSEKLAFH